MTAAVQCQHEKVTEAVDILHWPGGKDDVVAHFPSRCLQCDQVMDEDNK